MFQIAIDGLSRVFCTRNKTLHQQAAPGGITSRLMQAHFKKHGQGAAATAAAVMAGRGDKKKPRSAAGGTPANRSSTIITNEGVVAIPRQSTIEGDSSPTAAIAAAIGMTSPATSAPSTGPPRPPTSLVNGGVNVSVESSTNALVSSVNSSMDRKSMEVILKHLANTQRTLKDLQENTEKILSALKEKDVTKTLRQLRLEWQMVAMTLDRIFFLIFALAIVLSLVTLFPRPYQMTFGE